MKALGLFLVLIGAVAMNHAEAFGWGAFFLCVVGLCLAFPNLLQYIFQGQTNERK